MSFVIIGVFVLFVVVRICNNLDRFGTLTTPTCQKRRTWSRYPKCNCPVCRQRRELGYADYRHRRRQARY